MKISREEQEEQENLEEKIKLLWRFIYSLKDHRNLLKQIGEDVDERASLVVSAAVLNPFGFKTAEAKYMRIAKRAKLLVEMIDILEETDKDVLEAAEKEKGWEKVKENLTI